MADRIKVVLKKSPIGSTVKQRATVKGLGLKRLNSFKYLKDSAEVRGMVNKVCHLVDVIEEEVS